MSQEGPHTFKPEDGVEGLKKKLYSRGSTDPMRDVRTPLTPDMADAPHAWADSKPSLPDAAASRMLRQTPRRGWSFASKFFIGSVLFFVVAAGAAAYFFFGGGNFISSNNIDLQLVAPSLVDGGSSATIQYIITNHNAAELQLADLVIEYPDGTRDPKNPAQGLPNERQTVGTIAPGQQLKRTSTAIFYGQEGSSQVVHATLEYSISGSNAVFTKQGDVTITVGSSPVSVSVDAPQEASAGEPFDMTLSVRSNSQTPIDNVVVQAQYPFGFTVGSTVPAAEAGGSYWRLGTMAPGTTQQIVVHGSIDGQDGDQRVFKFFAGSDADPTDTSIKTPFLSVPASLTIRRPFITGTILVNGQSGKTIAATAGAVLQGEVDWQNNLTTAVSNVEITVHLSGPTLDKTSVQSGTGFYQSSDNSITWTAQQDPSLAQVAPGAVGKLTFSFSSFLPGTGGSLYSNPTLGLSLTVKGMRPDETGVPQQVSVLSQTQINLASAVSLAATAARTGRAPVAGNSSTYTLNWSVKNSSNIVANAAVTTVLPPYIDFVSGASGVTYDAGSRTVTWTIGDLAPGAGYTAAAPAANFMVKLNASLSQVNQKPALMGASQLKGTDRFAQTAVSATAPEVDADLVTQ